MKSTGNYDTAADGLKLNAIAYAQTRLALSARLVIVIDQQEAWVEYQGVRVPDCGGLDKTLRAAADAVGVLRGYPLG